MAVRQALGASRRHVVSEAIVETTLLTLAGGLLGLAAGAGGIRLLACWARIVCPWETHIAFDARLAMVAVVGAVVHGTCARGADRVVQSARPSGERDPIRDSRRNGQPRRAKPAPRLYRRADRDGIGSVERARVCSGSAWSGRWLFLPAFGRTMFSPAKSPLPWNRYPNWPARLAFNERLLTEIARQPGVLAAGVGQQCAA